MNQAKYELSAIQYPTGRWGFVGDVPMGLAYVQADGQPLTEDQMDAIQQCGPGILGQKVKAVTFGSREEAIAAKVAWEKSNGQEAK